MPIYEYRCPDCGHQFENWVSRASLADEPVECPECAGRAVERLLSSFAAGGSSSSGAGRSTGTCAPRGGFT